MTALRSWPIQGGQAGRRNFFKLSLQLGGGGGGGGQVVPFSFAEWYWSVDSLSVAKLRPWENISPPTLAPAVKRSSSRSGKRNYHRRVSRWIAGCAVFKVHLLAERSWADMWLCKGPERILRTSAVSDLGVPTAYHKCVSWVFGSLSRTV